VALAILLFIAGWALVYAAVKNVSVAALVTGVLKP
jgi:hypothetical protein